MFKENDVVVYGAQGVCEIVGIDERKVDGELKSYFVLHPKSNNGALFYVPTWNEKALGKMRKVKTKEEIEALIDSLPQDIPSWIENESERKAAYKSILASGDAVSMISMLQVLFIHKKERESEGKRMHMSDEHFLKDAEQLLYNEWQYVLNMDKEGIKDYISERINQHSRS